jgi:formamidopyrimidine-DNA glycosylase
VGVGPATLSPIRKFDGLVVKKFTTLLKGQKIIDVKRRAKLLIFSLSPTSPKLRRTGGLSILAHLKMTGQFIFEDKALRKKTGGQYRLLNKLTAPLQALPSKHTHVVFEFTDASKLYFNDVRKFGYLKLVHDDEINEVRELKEYGPEPLDKTFTLSVLSTAVNKLDKRKIKEALMDSKVVAGIGNIYSDEILFHAGVRPTRQVARIKKQELIRIYNAIKAVLTRGIKAKGSSVGDFIRTDGSWGQMGKYHYVYGRKGRECKKCGTIIESIKLGGRTGSFCPKCQQ